MSQPLFRMLPLAVAVSLCLSENAARAEESLRVMTYNVRNCRGLDDASCVNVERIARVITEQAPDVVAVQELDLKTKRSAGRDMLHELAVATAMKGTYAEAIPFEEGSYGVAVLSKRKPLRFYQLPLPGREEARTLLVCEFETFAFFCTHLSLTAESRLASVEIINRERAKFEKPVVLAGDFNAGPDSGTVRELEKVWKRVGASAPTFPADKPDRTIDYIFIATDKEVETAEETVVDEPAASDHRPVFAALKIK